MVILTRLHELFSANAIKNVLVIAPKSALGAWERDLETKFWCNRLIQNAEKGEKLMLENITFVSYDKVWRGGTENTYYKEWDCIVLDESHFIKNHTSKRAKFILKLAVMSKYRYIMTGTPIGNGQLENIWSQYTFLFPTLKNGRVCSELFGGSYTAFINRYCTLNKYFKPSSYIRVDELQDIINKHCYRVKKVDCLDLPDKLPDQVIKIELVEKAKYKKLATESALLEYDILADNPLSRLVKLRQFVSGHIKLDNGEIVEIKHNKIKYLAELLEMYDNKKLVIFAEFKQSIKDIIKLLNKLKIKYVVLDGDQKNKTIWRDFQSSDKIRIIVCQYQTANAGIDLYASDMIIYYEPTLRSVVLEQSRDRIHRSGQKNTCNYVHLITTNTVEEHIYNALVKYQDFNEKLFNEYIEYYKRR